MLPDQGSQRLALVTGAASGLGRSLAMRLANAGYTLVLADVESEGLQAVRDEICISSPDSLAVTMDVRQAGEWQRVRDVLDARGAQLDLLINSAGVLAVGDFFDSDPTTIERVIQVNLVGTMIGCQVLGGHLLANPRGAHIVNVASCAAFLTFPWSSAYNAAKAGVLAYSETLANELARSSVGLTVACPGFFPSSLMEAAACTDEVTARCMHRVFERSSLTADEVADAILRAIRRKRLYVLVPFKVRCWWWYKRFLPAQLMRSVQRIAFRLRNRYAAKVAAGHDD